MNSFKLKIYATNGVFYDDDAYSLNIKTIDGMYAIQALHRDTILALVPGKISFIDKNEDKHDLIVSDGIVNICKNVVLLIVENCYREEDYEKSIQKEKEDLVQEELNQKQALKEYSSAQARIAKMMNKLSGNDDI